MEENSAKYHNYVLAQHSRNMFETLLYESHITSNNLKTIELENPNKLGLPEGFFRRGFFLTKGRTKYWLDEKYKTNKGNIDSLSMLPIRASKVEERVYKDDVISLITKPIQFSITPSKTFNSVKEFIDGLFPFQHENPDAWTLMKIIAVMGFVGKTICTVSTQPAFGKTAIFSGLNCINNMSPVFKPRSVPGMLNHINSMGNIAFDEIQNCNSEVRKIIEDIILFVGDGKPTYHNGALASRATKQTYDISMQSMTFLVNRMQDYKNPEKTFFDFIFDNKNAVNDRVLKVKLDGCMKQVFNTSFDIIKTAEENRMYYIKIAKYLLYLQETKQRNAIESPFKPLYEPQMSNRQASTYNEFKWLIGLYSESQEEFNRLIEVLNKGVMNYQAMLNTDNTEKNMNSVEEVFIDDDL